MYVILDFKTSIYCDHMQVYPNEIKSKVSKCKEKLLRHVILPSAIRSFPQHINHDCDLLIGLGNFNMLTRNNKARFFVLLALFAI